MATKDSRSSVTPSVLEDRDPLNCTISLEINTDDMEEVDAPTRSGTGLWTMMLEQRQPSDTKARARLCCSKDFGCH